MRRRGGGGEEGTNGMMAVDHEVEYVLRYVCCGDVRDWHVLSL